MAKEVVIGIITGVIILVIGGIVAFFVQKPVQEILERPDVIAIDQYNEKVCPETISFKTREEVAPFSIKVQNIGTDGMAFMKISSDT